MCTNEKPVYFQRHWDPLIGRPKLGRVLPLASSLSRPQLLSTSSDQIGQILTTYIARSRLFSTIAGQINQTCVGSSVSERFAYAAMLLKRGIRWK